MFPFLIPNLHPSGMNRILLRHLTSEFVYEDGSIAFNAHDYPLLLEASTKEEIRSLQLTPRVPVSNSELLASVGNIRTTNPLNPNIKWRPRHQYFRDQIHARPFTWEDMTNRTESFVLRPGDSLCYEANLRTGRYFIGDTNVLTAGLNDSTDYVKLRLELRDEASRSVLAILDSVILEATGAFASLALADSAVRTAVGYGGGSSVYIGLCAYRGMPNQFNVDLMSAYGSPVLALRPPEGIVAPKPTTRKESSAIGSIEVNLAPNPIRDWCTVTVCTPDHGEVSIELFDLLGREVANLFDGTIGSSTSILRFNLSDVAPGTYFLRASDKRTRVTRRVVIE